MHVLKAGPGLVYMRIRSDRMPTNFYVVYRVFGIDSVADWHRGESYRYDGIMAYDEANAAIDRDAADAPAMGPVDEGPAADDAAIDRDAAVVPAMVPADDRHVTDLDP